MSDIEEIREALEQAYRDHLVATQALLEVVLGVVEEMREEIQAGERGADDEAIAWLLEATGKQLASTVARWAARRT